MKSFMQLIRETDRGRLLDDSEEALESIIAAINENGGSGTVTIKLKISKKADAFIIGGTMAHTIPQRDRVSALFFFDENREELTQKDPRQPNLPHVVKGSFGKNEKIDDETGEVTNG